MVVFNPFSDVDVKFIPAFLLNMINDKILMQEPEKIYELQVNSMFRTYFLWLCWVFYKPFLNILTIWIFIIFWYKKRHNFVYSDYVIQSEMWVGNTGYEVKATDKMFLPT